MPPALGRPAAMMSPIYADVPAPQNQTSLMPSCDIQLLYASAEKSFDQARQMSGCAWISCQVFDFWIWSGTSIYGWVPPTCSSLGCDTMSHLLHLVGATL